MQDDLLPEYDLEKLRVRGVGPERKSIGGKPVNQFSSNASIVLRDDVSVNKTLLILIRATNSRYNRKRRSSLMKLTSSQEYLVFR